MLMPKLDSHESVCLHALKGSWWPGSCLTRGMVGSEKRALKCQFRELGLQSVPMFSFFPWCFRVGPEQCFTLPCGLACSVGRSLSLSRANRCLFSYSWYCPSYIRMCCFLFLVCLVAFKWRFLNIKFGPLSVGFVWGILWELPLAISGWVRSGLLHWGSARSIRQAAGRKPWHTPCLCAGAPAGSISELISWTVRYFLRSKSIM